jgi:hypothetical protein
VKHAFRPGVSREQERRMDNTKGGSMARGIHGQGDDPMCSDPWVSAEKTLLVGELGRIVNQ